MKFPVFQKPHITEDDIREKIEKTQEDYSIEDKSSLPDLRCDLLPQAVNGSSHYYKL
jgi:hypothetical protein